jgi:hypothetical protein
MLATIVQTGDLVKTIVASVVAGVGVTVIFSLAIWSAARFVDLSRADRPVAAGAAALLGGLSLAATAAAIAVGIIVMTQK